MTIVQKRKNYIFIGNKQLGIGRIEGYKRGINNRVYVIDAFIITWFNCSYKYNSEDFKQSSLQGI